MKCLPSLSRQKTQASPTQIHSNPKSVCNANYHLSEEEDRDLCGSHYPAKGVLIPESILCEALHKRPNRTFYLVISNLEE